MRHLSFNEGDVIFREGTYGETMYEITAGKVDIIAKYETEDQTLLSSLGAGEIFGEMGLIEFLTRSATAIAKKDGTEVNEINKDGFMTFLQDRPEKVLAIMRQLSARLRETNEKYQEACLTVYEAVEAERARERRSKGLRARIYGLLQQLKSDTR